MRANRASRAPLPIQNMSVAGQGFAYTLEKLLPCFWGCLKVNHPMLHLAKWDLPILLLRGAPRTGTVLRVPASLRMELLEGCDPVPGSRVPKEGPPCHHTFTKHLSISDSSDLNMKYRDAFLSRFPSNSGTLRSSDVWKIHPFPPAKPGV